MSMRILLLLTLLSIVSLCSASRRIGERANLLNEDTPPTNAPIVTKSPSATQTKSPSSTEVPTKAPSVTESPTKSPSSTETPTRPPSVTVFPTSNSQTTAPTKAPSTTVVPTIAPVITAAPTLHHAETSAPTAASITLSPTTMPTASGDTNPPHRISFFRILTKTLAWIILLGLGLLGFGAIMNHRYRIYFFLRGVWFTILAQPCTQWILRKLRLDGEGTPVDNGLNTIIFDNDMTSGLLLQENNHGYS